MELTVLLSGQPYAVGGILTFNVKPEFFLEEDQEAALHLIALQSSKGADHRCLKMQRISGDGLEVTVTSVDACEMEKPCLGEASSFNQLLNELRLPCTEARMIASRVPE